MLKVESAMIQFVLREYNEAGELIGEGPAQVQQVFRGRTPDIWKRADEVLAEMEKTIKTGEKSAIGRE